MGILGTTDLHRFAESVNVKWSERKFTCPRCGAKKSLGDASRRRAQLMRDVLGLDGRRYDEVRRALPVTGTLRPELLSRVAKCSYEDAERRIQLGLATGVLAKGRGGAIGTAQGCCIECYELVARLNAGAISMLSGADPMPAAAMAAAPSAGDREPIPRSVQREVWRRDGGACVQCGSRERLEYDHIIPVSRGGATTVRNLQLLCERCNRRKGAQVG
ncbi:MAG: HNH endonuclease [Candidatus Limnocylindrales bacterium]